jgi:hypothetical protein
MEMLKQIDGYADTSAPQLSYHWYTGIETRHRILVCFEMPNGNLVALLFRLEQLQYSKEVSTNFQFEC